MKKILFAILVLVLISFASGCSTEDGETISQDIVTEEDSQDISAVDTRGEYDSQKERYLGFVTSVMCETMLGGNMGVPGYGDELARQYGFADSEEVERIGNQYTEADLNPEEIWRRTVEKCPEIMSAMESMAEGLK